VTFNFGIGHKTRERDS